MSKAANPKKIFVFDDSMLVRNEMRQLIESLGHQVVDGDGSTALDVMEKNPDVHLVFCDVHMPVMNGLEVIEKFKARPNFKTIPVFMLTSETNEELKARGKAAGVNGWIMKPIVRDK